ncbi:hypothetical protein B0H16DRAFT_1247778, partial [Mycena metata]
RLSIWSAPFERSERRRNCWRPNRGTLRDRLNAYTYPVLTLPPEVMSEIFVHFLPVYPKRAPQKGLLSPSTLGQICCLWREIAFSTPQLWRTVKIFLRPG